VLRKGVFHMNKISSRQRNINKRIRGVTMPIKRKRIRWCRNWPCSCGSEKKYKNCCMNEMDSFTAYDDNADIAKIPDDIKKIIDIRREDKNYGGIGKNG